jgi:hypothetical protein
MLNYSAITHETGIGFYRKDGKMQMNTLNVQLREKATKNQDIATGYFLCL